MAPTKIPHLCGGTLFDLFLETRKPRRKARNKRSGGTDGLTAADVYSGLIEVVTGEKMNYAGKAFNKCVSNYKNCSSSKGVYVPFTEHTTQSAFDAQYKRKDPDLLERMSGFIDTYLNEKKCEWLVRALIETMQQEQLDIDIAINYTDSLKVSDLHTAASIELLPFLLSVLYYIMTNCPDCESGRPTFESWYTQSSPKAEWKFKSNIGEGINPMNVSFNHAVAKQLDSKSKDFSSNNETYGYSDTCNDNQVITEHLGKSLQPLVDALEAQKKQIPNADQIAKPLLAFATAAKTQEHGMSEKIRSNEKKDPHQESSEDLYYTFKTESDRIMQYCIEKDPTAEPISLYLPDQIDFLIRKWNFEIRKIQEPDKQILIQKVLQTLSDYLYYLSDKYLKAIDGERLIFRNSSIEEGDRLRNELMPKSYELRCKLRDLYLKLWPAPALDHNSTEAASSEQASADSESNKDTKESVVHQTIVNQYGDHPVHIDHVENLKL